MIVDPNVFLTIGSVFTKRTANFHLREAAIKFKNIIGVGPVVCSAMWRQLWFLNLINPEDV